MDTRELTIAALVVAVVGSFVFQTSSRRHSPRGLIDFVAALAAMAVPMLVASIAIMRWAQFSPIFDLAHLIYLVMVIAIPVVGASTLVNPRRSPTTRPLRVVSALAICLAPIGWYGTHVAPYRLHTVTASKTLPVERSGSDPIRIGVLADLQTSEITGYERRAVANLMATRADIILITGDLFQGDETQFAEQLPGFRDLLREIDAPGGVFAVRGDTDTGDRLDLLTSGSDIVILDDEIVTTEVEDRTVAIGGNQLLWAPFDAVAMRNELADRPNGQVRILMAHRPEVITGLPPDADIDLTVAGHTHGGQIALPFFGPLVNPSRVPRSVAAGGLHKVSGNSIYVSTGVGMARLEAPQVRLGTRPTIAVIDLF